MFGFFFHLDELNSQNSCLAKYSFNLAITSEIMATVFREGLRQYSRNKKIRCTYWKLVYCIYQSFLLSLQLQLSDTTVVSDIYSKPIKLAQISYKWSLRFQSPKKHLEEDSVNCLCSEFWYLCCECHWKKRWWYHCCSPQPSSSPSQFFFHLPKPSPNYLVRNCMCLHRRNDTVVSGRFICRSRNTYTHSSF